MIFKKIKLVKTHNKGCVMKKAIYPIVILFILFLVGIVSAQSISWTRTHNGLSNDNDLGFCIAVDSNGNVYVAGTEVVTGESGNIWIRKYDSNGNTIWTRTHNGVANNGDAGNSITVDSSGNVYVTGYEGVAGESFNIWIRKYNPDGSTNWTRTHNGSANGQDAGNSITVDSNGNVYVTGSEDVTGEAYNIWIRKYDSSGNTNWTRTHNGSGNDNDGGYGIAVDSSGNVYVTGYEEVTGESDNIWIRKYDSSGNTIWTRTYNDSDNLNDFGQGIAVDSSSNVYVAGSEVVAGESFNIWIRKYNPDGSTNWTRTHNGAISGSDHGRSIAVDSSGNVYVTGFEDVTGESANIWVRKYSFFPPSVPQGISTISISTEQINLIWNDLTNETSYTLFRNTVNDSTNATNVKGFLANNTNHNDTALSPDTTYYYWVKAYNGNGGSDYSTVESNKTMPLPLPGTPVLNSTILSANDVVLSWAIVSNTTGYKIMTNGVANLAATLSSNITSWTAHNGALNTTNTYYIIATNYVGSSDIVSNVVAFLLPGTPVWTTTNQTNIQVNLVWNTVPNVTGYSLFRSESTNLTNALDNVGAGTTNYSDLAIQSGKTYYYWIKAYNNSGVSIHSVMITIVIPELSIDPPQNAFAYPTVCPTGGVIKFNYVDPISDIEIYNIAGELVETLGASSPDEWTPGSGIGAGNYIAIYKDKSGKMVQVRFIYGVKQE